MSNNHKGSSVFECQLLVFESIPAFTPRRACAARLTACVSMKRHHRAITNSSSAISARNNDDLAKTTAFDSVKKALSLTTLYGPTRQCSIRTRAPPFFP